MVSCRHDMVHNDAYVVICVYGAMDRHNVTRSITGDAAPKHDLDLEIAALHSVGIIDSSSPGSAHKMRPGSTDLYCSLIAEDYIAPVFGCPLEMLVGPIVTDCLAAECESWCSARAIGKKSTADQTAPDGAGVCLDTHFML